MKLISVVWFKVLPAKFGGQKGTALFNKYLAERFELSCLCSSNNEKDASANYKLINKLPISKWQFIDPFCWKAILQSAKKEGANALILEYPYHGIAAVLAKSLLGIPFILHQHNIEYERFRQLGKWWWRLLKVYERWTCRRADLVLFKTTEDRNIAIQQFAIAHNKSFLLPYGIELTSDTNEPSIIKTKYGLTDEAILLFAGTLDYAPNAEAVKAVYQKLAPQLDHLPFKYKIFICGRNRNPAFSYLKELAHPNILQAGEVEDIIPYFEAASVFINPVLTGGGVQTKIIDALSYHCNTVAFEYGLTSIDKAVCGEKIFPVANENWKEFAQAVYGAAGRKSDTPPLFFETYSWRNIINNIAPHINALGK
ncbi:MAG: glycosyltransferase family 4 protein [Flaviaesturariibacter sp.]|nr:glycosyltransferase family 4 protein [Flaviaesturariibacter sp.]